MTYTTTITTTTKSVTREAESDLVLDLAMSGLQLAASAVLSGAATSAVKSVKEAANEAFHKAADQVKINLGNLFTDQSTTTTTLTLSSTEFVERVEDSAVIQQFFIQDTNEGMNVSIFYDRLFGTYVFVPHEEGSGFVRDPRFQNLPTIVWELEQPTAGAAHLTVPEDVRRQLEDVGAVVLDPSREEAFRVAAGHRRLPITASPRLTNSGWQPVTLPAERVVGNTQGLYIARDRGGQAVAQVWLSISE